MEFQLAVSSPADSQPFELWVEPEGMYYEFPAVGPIVLAFRGPDAMRAELSYHPDKVIIWRPADTEVWATRENGDREQIAGWKDIPAPGLDTAGAPLEAPVRGLIENLFHGNGDGRDNGDSP
ncbi:hypothetical protein QLQ12_19735 [Actinoplanes sp. NEAU-A12]|uniref:Uncharacterized protein n=1 Tax=Actinoplanes sandaracinus TaxID=3045177 RepID=A0ABT6WM83_9ACTN|nr:hypothetical protein [Actinoplanes sandaracinus]MDI6100847.1 hypothetical protein [Actinoplanes sandaracinus]